MLDMYAPIHPYQSPRLVSAPGVKVREDTLYTNRKGEEKRGIRKRAEKAVQKLEEPLRRLLQPDEAILYIAQAQVPTSLFERLTMGFYLFYVTKSALVLTNRRLLHLAIKRDGSWKNRVRSVSWGEVEERRIKGWLSPELHFKYRDGRKEFYWGLRRADATKIKVLLAVLLPASAGEASSALSVGSLCPNCFAALTPGAYRCSHCGAGFKDERTMVRRSLLIPGGGYFYTEQWFLGVGDFVVEALLLWMTVRWVLIAVGMLKEDLQPCEPAATTGVALFLAAFVAGILAIEKWVAIRHCRRRIREFIRLK